MRINKYLARCGIGSRRKCDEYIENGKIKINDKIVTNFSYSVKDTDYVQYKNRMIDFVDEDYIYILNKPRGYICSSNDPKGRKKIIDLIPTTIRLFNIGRLDYNTTGIILLTNNGDIANHLLHPKSQIIKQYHIESDEKISNNNIEMIEKGFIIPGFGKVKAKLDLLKSSKNSFIWNIILREGKNREIKRIFNHFNSQIKKLHRYEFAGIQLGNLKSAKYKRISYKKFNRIFISQ